MDATIKATENYECVIRFANGCAVHYRNNVNNGDLRTFAPGGEELYETTCADASNFVGAIRAALNFEALVSGGTSHD